MRKIFVVFILLLLLVAPSFAGVKRSDLAGRWYPEDESALRKELASYLDKVPPLRVDGEIIAIISPHAGLPYSGPVAAYGFKAVENKDIKTVIVVGFSHRGWYDGIAVLDEDGFETPLGTIKIDREITGELIKKDPRIRNQSAAFTDENSVEMEIPFLQIVLKDFKIVLIAMGRQGFENCKVLGEALGEILKTRDKFLLVASTDMCHYLPYADANKIDAKTISVIQEFDPDKLYAASLAREHQLMCGFGAVCATMIASKKLGADRMEILKYANSGDTSGDKGRVVGYLSAAFVKSEIRNPKSEINPKSKIQNSKKGDENMLNAEQRKKMLKLARDSITHYLQTGKRLAVKENDPALNAEMGAFVTLHKRGQLRGCIGNMVGRGPFYITVRDMAVEAATGDPRFQPVTLDEMEDINIEISALSPLEKIDDPEKIVAGKHGVVVRQGFTSGVYLPQVATEQGWDREQFMNSLCGHKAGMRPDAWKRGECDMHIFTAEVFGEKER